MALLQINEPGKNSNSEVKKDLCIGIDFGTTNCVCSVILDEKVILIPDEYGKFVIPTITKIKKNEILFGNQLFNDEKYDISEFIFSIKRLFVKEPDKKRRFLLHDDKYSPVEVAALIFKYLKNCSDLFLKVDVKKCVVTVPAYFDEKARSAIKKSATIAGFDVLRLVNEPTSAAYAYGLEKKKRGTYFVYDLGGGTFDVSILKLTDGIFKVLATGGDPNLGGDDLDKSFAEKILKDFFNLNFNSLDEKEKISFLKKCKFLKEKLTVTNSFFTDLKIEQKLKRIKIDQNLLNKSIQGFLEKTMLISNNILIESELSISDLDGFILVGGSTKINLVSELIKKNFGLKIFSDLNPDFVVARGAALHANSLIHGGENLLLDVTPLSLGIETAGGLMEKIIDRNSSIPIIKEQEFTTSESGQTAIKIHILQGERETVENNRSLGEFNLEGIEPKPPGIPRIKVRFVVDSNGILSVSASESSSELQKELQVKPTHDLNVNKMNEMIKDSIKNSSKDMEKRLLMESKVDAQRFLNELDSIQDELIDICSISEIERINDVVKSLKEALKKNDRNLIKNIIQKLNNETQSFSEKRVKNNIKSALVGKNYDKI